MVPFTFLAWFTKWTPSKLEKSRAFGVDAIYVDHGQQLQCVFVYFHRRSEWSVHLSLLKE
jgi:hypothetical protein